MPLHNSGSSAWDNMLGKVKAEIGHGKRFGAQQFQVENFGLESLNEEQSNVLNTTRDGAAKSLVAFARDTGLFAKTDEKFNENHPGVRAAATIAAACEDIGGYAKALMKHEAAATGAKDAVTLMGRLSGRPTPGVKYAAGLEAFDEAQELRPNTEYSIAYNLRATKQDAAAELLFPTTTLEASDVGVRFNIPIPVLEDYIEHTGGTPVNWKRRRLIDAGRNGKLLITDATTLVPWKKPDGSTDDYFVDGALVPAAARRVRDESIPTAPLRAGEWIDVIGLSATPGLVGKGIVDGTYVIDADIKVVNAYFKVTKGEDSDVIKFKTSAIQLNAFQQAAEGDHRRMVLNMTVGALPMDQAKQPDGTDVTVLADLTANGNIPYLRFSLNGEVNVEGAMYGLTINGSSAKVARVRDSNGNDLDTTTGSVNDAIKALKFEFIGYDLDLRVRNSNLAQRGKRVDIKHVSRMYLTRIGEPISAIKPGVDSFGPVTGVQVETLANATYLRNSALALYRALDYFDQIKSFQNYAARDFEDNALEGVGTYFVDPTAIEIEVNFADITSSVSSSDRGADITASITNTIRELAYKLNALSGYGVAMNFLHPGEKIKVVAVADNYIAQFIQVFGDLRTMGMTFDFELAVSNLNEMRGTILVTLSRGSTNQVDPLTFGMHAWIPEVVSEAKMNRGGPYVHDLIVQPRNIHIPICPVMGKIKFVGMPDLYTGRINLNVNVEQRDTDVATNTVVQKQSLDGLNASDAAVSDQA